MNGAPIVVVEIDSKGNVQIEVFNVPGKACHSLTQDVEKSLGIVTNVKDKPEIHQLGTASNQQKIGGS